MMVSLSVCVLSVIIVVIVLLLLTSSSPFFVFFSSLSFLPPSPLPFSSSSSSSSFSSFSSSSFSSFSPSFFPPFSTPSSPPFYPSYRSISPPHHITNLPPPPGCAICLRDYACGDEIIAVEPCGHFFCGECTDQVSLVHSPPSSLPSPSITNAPNSGSPPPKPAAPCAAAPRTRWR